MTKYYLLNFIRFSNIKSISIVYIMPGLIEVVNKIARPYYKYVVMIVAAVIFGYAANYGYNAYFVKKQENKFADVPNAKRSNKEVSVMFFHVDWCPHCKTALPEWENFKKQYNNKEVNGYITKCVDVDCTDETSDTQNMINKYEIESYPTVKMVKDKNTIEFDSKISTSTLEHFVNSMLMD